MGNNGFIITHYGPDQLGDENSDYSDQTPLPVDRWWSNLGAKRGQDPDQGSCLGIRCNILRCARAHWQRRREITHHLRGGELATSVGVR